MATHRHGLVGLSFRSNSDREDGDRKFREIYAVGSIVLIGLLLRLPSLRLGLWRDEGSTYFNSIPNNLGEVFKTISVSELNPPGFYLLMHYWMQWFGATEIVLKLPALIFSLLTIAAVYILGREVGDRRIGIVAAVLTAIAPEAVYYAQEARPYSAIALLSCLVVLMYCKAIYSRDRTWYLLGFILCASSLLYVQYTGFLLVGSLGAVTLYLWRGKSKIPLVPLAIAFAIVGLLFLPWLPTFLLHYSIGSPWKDQIPWWGLPKRAIVNLIYTLPFQAHPLHIFLVFAGVAWLLWRDAEFWQLWRKPIAILALCFGISTGALTILTYTGRYMFFLAPIAWILYSSFLVASWRYLHRCWQNSQLPLARWTSWLLLLLYLGFALPNLSYALTLGNEAKSGLRALATDVKNQSFQQTFYVLAPDHLGPSFGYYFSSQSVPFYGFARWERPEIFRPKGYAAVWQDPAAIPTTLERIQTLTRQGYRQLAFIRQQPPKEANDIAYQPYHQSDRLLSQLQQTYPLLDRQDYPGKEETVTLFLFDVKPRP